MVKKYFTIIFGVTMIFIFTPQHALIAAISHPITDAAVEGFTRDWKSLYGDKTILDM